MKLEEFNANTEHLWSCIEDILITKQAEYAEEEDRLANFKQFCSLTGKVPPQHVVDYWLKHVGSIFKIAEDAQKGILPTRELLEEKCTDGAAYLFLFYSSMLELIQENESSHNGKIKVKVKPAVFERADLHFEDTDTLL